MTTEAGRIKCLHCNTPLGNGLNHATGQCVKQVMMQMAEHQHRTQQHAAMAQDLMAIVVALMQRIEDFVVNEHGDGRPDPLPTLTLTIADLKATEGIDMEISTDQEEQTVTIRLVRPEEPAAVAPPSLIVH